MKSLARILISDKKRSFSIYLLKKIRSTKEKLKTKRKTWKTKTRLKTKTKIMETLQTIQTQIIAKNIQLTALQINRSTQTNRSILIILTISRL